MRRAPHLSSFGKLLWRCRRNRSATFVLRYMRARQSDRDRYRSRSAALGRRAAGDGSGGLRPAASRRGVRRYGHIAEHRTAVRAKSTPTDPVTVVDTETERLLRERLAELRPGEHVLGEEEGGSIGPVIMGGRRGCWTPSTARSTSSTGSRPTRCRWPYSATARRWPGPWPTCPPARCIPRRSATAHRFAAPM